MQCASLRVSVEYGGVNVHIYVSQQTWLVFDFIDSDFSKQQFIAVRKTTNGVQSRDPSEEK